MSAIAFTTTVTDRDWDGDLSAWRCPALKIPGARVEAFFVSGSRTDSSWYEVSCELNIVRWVHFSAPPQQATILIKLTEELSTRELTLKWKKLAIILPLATSIVVALIAGIFAYRSSIPTPANSTTAETPLSCADQLRIVVPAEDATVPIEVTVQGTYQDLPPGTKIYVLVYPAEIGRYYPQRNTVQQKPDNTWSGEVNIGIKRDAGKRFVLYAVLADKAAQNDFNMYVRQDMYAEDSPGLADLPKGAMICSSVRVRRK